MLETLTIKNVAVIDLAEVPFTAGLNILSGETGAGKSIVIEAISLILGSRANTDLIRADCEEAVVEGLFTTRDIPWLQARMERLGFGAGQELLIRRTIHKAGRHRIYVNGQLATLSILQELCDGLVDLCGQHEHQTLLRANTQMELLDRYGGLSDQTRVFGEMFASYRALIQERETLTVSRGEMERRTDFLKFQIAELSEAQLTHGEDESLANEKQLLQSAASRIQTAESVCSALESDENGMLDGIRAVTLRFRTLIQLDPSMTPQMDAMERALAELEEVSLHLNRYVRSVETDSDRLSYVQDRLTLIADLKRKYGPGLSDVIHTLEKLEAEYEGLSQSDERLEALTAKLGETETSLRKAAQKLSQARKKVSDLLAKSVTAELKDLRMSEARFTIDLSSKEDFGTWSANGGDQIQFLVQTNLGETARPLGKIASGGELSRLMLAIRRVISDKGGIGVYLFDEIDAGIGGQTAFQVGKKLKSVAAFNQVICITHLPQVASFADHHLSVRKASHGKRTVTEIVELDKPERKQELARMLGGPLLTKKSLDNAAELLDLAR